MLVIRMVGRQVLQHDIAHAIDDAEKVVEIVGHAAGQSPDGLHLLGLAQLFLQVSSVRDVYLHSDEVGESFLFVLDRRNRQFGPEGGAVLPVIEQFDRGGPFLTNGLANFGDGPGIGVRALEKAAITAEDFFLCIAGECQETGTGVDNRIVGQVGVGDDNSLGDRLNGAIFNAECLLGPLCLGNVPEDRYATYRQAIFSQKRRGGYADPTAFRQPVVIDEHLALLYPFPPGWP